MIAVPVSWQKGQQVWTGYCDEEALSLGVYKTYTEENLRYTQNAPLNMYDEVNTKCNLPAQIDIEATEGMEYKFLCVTKGGGSANKTYLYQETKAILNPGTLVPFLVEKMKTLGTAACPPYHIAFVIGGTSAEKNLLTVKLAERKYTFGSHFSVAQESQCHVFVVFTCFRVAQNLRYLLVVRTAKHERYVAESSISHRCQTFFLYFHHRCSFELAY